MKRIIVFLILFSLILSQIAYALEEKDGKIILSKEELIKLDSYIRKLEEENKLLRKKIEILEEALDKYKERSLEIEQDLKKQLEVVQEQFNKKQEQIVIYQLEIKKKDMEISKERAQKILFGILGIGLGYLISKIQK